MSVEQYVALDAESDERWEYANGEAWATRGASPEHAVVVRNVLVELSSKLEGRPCRPLGDGQKIGTSMTGAFHYPDASVVCGPPRFDASEPRAIVNPTTIVEVLSPTTADYDRGGKLAHYRTLETLEDYILVSWDTRVIEHHRRVAVDQWIVTLVREGTLELPSLGISLSLHALWRDLDWIRSGTD